MKFPFILCTLLFTTLSIYGQTNEFAPVGATWWYSNQVNVDSPYIAQLLQVESDTTIVGKYCKIITGYINDTIYIHSEDNVIFQYFETEDKFLKLYDFNLNTGDSYWLHGMTVTGIDSVLVYIENVQDTTINGIELKKQSISIDGIYFDWSNTIIQKIGNTKFLIPIYSIFDLQPGPLRCYEDDELGLVETGIVENCDVITGVTDRSIDFEIYPINRGIQVNTVSQEYLANIYNIQGQLVYSNYHVYSTFINMDRFSAGFYIVYINFNTHASTFKFELL